MWNLSAELSQYNSFHPVSFPLKRRLSLPTIAY